MSFYYKIDLEIEQIYSIIIQRSNDELDEKNNKYEKSLDKITDFSIWDILNVLASIGTKVAIAGKAKSDVNKVKGRVELENKKVDIVINGINQNKKSDGIDDIIEEVVELEYKKTEILDYGHEFLPCLPSYLPHSDSSFTTTCNTSYQNIQKALQTRSYKSAGLSFVP